AALSTATFSAAFLMNLPNCAWADAGASVATATRAAARMRRCDMGGILGGRFGALGGGGATPGPADATEGAPAGPASGHGTKDAMRPRGFSPVEGLSALG